MNFRLFLLPFSLIYSGTARLRNFLFDSGVFKQHIFKQPIILVGNLSVGGTGKTPHVEYLLDLLRKHYRLATLSRGYGRKTSGFVLAGKGSTSSQVGDEPMQYFSKFEDVTVAVCENRVEGISKLMEISKPDLIIMDDGFQHRQVDPGLKIMLTSIDNLFTRDHVLPAGDLREPRSGYQRADVVLVTRCDEKLSGEEKALIIKDINPLPHQQIFFSSLIYENPAHFFNYQSLPLAELPSKKVILFSGIASHTHLESFVKNQCQAMESLRFADHHDFTSGDISMLKEKFDKFADNSAILLTTEKDYQRLRNTDLIKELLELPCYFIPIKVKIDRQDEFNQIITRYVEANKENS